MSTTAEIMELPAIAIPTVVVGRIHQLVQIPVAVPGSVRSVPAGVSTPVGEVRFKGCGGRELPYVMDSTAPVSPFLIKGA